MSTINDQASIVSNALIGPTSQSLESPTSSSSTIIIDMTEKLLNLIGYRNENERKEKNPIEDSDEYRSFRGEVALKQYVIDDDNSKAWLIYECGPKDNRTPLIFLTPVSGTADIFFKQLKYLSKRGYRVLSIEQPNYFMINEFIEGFRRFIEKFEFEKVHLFGASLGGFLAQKFAEENPNLVASIILCNSFADTSRFKFVNMVPLIWINPSPILRNIFIDQTVPNQADQAIRDATQMMSEKLQTLTHERLISRLSLNLTENYVQPKNLQQIPITLIDVFDHCANSDVTRDELYKMYPLARRAHLKNGGNFPYLSRSDEVNMHLLVHLRHFYQNNDQLSWLAQSTANTIDSSKQSDNIDVTGFHDETKSVDNDYKNKRNF